MENEINKIKNEGVIRLNLQLVALFFFVTFLAIPAFASEPILLAQTSLIENSFLPGANQKQGEILFSSGSIVDDHSLSMMVGMGADNSNIEVHQAPNVILWDEDGRGKRSIVNQSENTGTGNIQESTVTMTAR
jgi:hypothetical protein